VGVERSPSEVSILENDMKPDFHLLSRVRAASILTGFLLFLGFCAPSIAQTGEPQQPREIVVGMLEAFPPYYLLDEQGRADGFAIDVMEQVAARAGLEVRFVPFKTGKETQSALEHGRVDVISGLGITESRKQIFAFTVPFQTFRISLFVRDNEEMIRGLADLAGHQVGVVESNAAHRMLKQRNDIKLKVFPDITTALFALLAGHVASVAYPEPIVWKWWTTTDNQIRRGRAQGKSGATGTFGSRGQRLRRFSRISGDLCGLVRQAKAILDHFTHCMDHGRVDACDTDRHGILALSLGPQAESGVAEIDYPTRAS
jgi:hypothetical protein